MGSRCKTVTAKTLNPKAPLFRPTATPTKSFEPPFNRLLSGTYSHVLPEMPTTRTPMHTVFVDRDEGYYNELERLKRAIIVRRAYDIGVDRIAEYISSSSLVEQKDLTFAFLTRCRVLIHLPPRVSPEEVISTIPREAWDIGLAFQIWTPLENASVNIPNYRLIVNILDIPLYLYREREVIRATSSIGLYLGTVT